MKIDNNQMNCNKFFKVFLNFFLLLCGSKPTNFYTIKLRGFFFTCCKTWCSVTGVICVVCISEFDAELVDIDTAFGELILVDETGVTVIKFLGVANLVAISVRKIQN